MVVGEREPGRDPLWHQPVAARLGDQDLGVGWIGLDLLAQAIDVSFQGMGRDARVVAPNLAQQRLAPDHVGVAAVEIFQDRGFHLGQADLPLRLAVNQQLGAGPEGVGADREDRVLALLVLTQLRPQARQQNREAERLTT